MSEPQGHKLTRGSATAADVHEGHRKRGLLGLVWWVIHLWAGGARRVELKAVHLWVSRSLTPAPDTRLPAPGRRQLTYWAVGVWNTRPGRTRLCEL